MQGCDMNRPPWLRIVSVVFMLAGLALCFFALWKSGVAQYRDFLRADLIASLGVAGCAALVASALSWQNYLFALSQRRLSFPEAFYQVGLVLVGKYVPIILGGVLARVGANASRTAASNVIAATILEQCGALVAASFVGAACIAYTFAWPLGIAILLCALLATVIVPFITGPTLKLMLWLRSRVRRQSAFEIALLDRHSTRVGWLMQIAQWLALSVFVALVLHAIRPAMAPLDILYLCGAYGIAVVVGIAAFMFPGGIGAREAAFVWIASHVVGYDTGLVMATALRVAMTGIDLLAGAGCLLHWMTHAADKRKVEAP
jgi:hypothetical protein